MGPHMSLAMLVALQEGLNDFGYAVQRRVVRPRRERPRLADAIEPVIDEAQIEVILLIGDRRDRGPLGLWIQQQAESTTARSDARLVPQDLALIRSRVRSRIVGGMEATATC